ncbi:MAG: hypothetical protein RL685_3410 [Pseudomonadota bacterium]|jgi:hypothetical protein
MAIERVGSPGITAGSSLVWGLGVALGLSACSAGGSGTAPERELDPPGSRVVQVPESMQGAAPPVLDQPGDALMADLIGDDVIGATLPPPIQRRGLLEKQVTCPNGGTTSVSGTVYIPSGQLPLYNATVYVPDAALSPLTPGVSCNCEITGEPVATALTDASGRFVLQNVPVGANIPLVVQMGDWRREFNIGTVAGCTDNPVSDQTLRLPSNSSQGDIPRIAVATGRADALECLVRKLGLDDSEFTNERDGGRVTLFAGQGGTERFALSNRSPSFASAQALWGNVESLSQYDVVLMSCDADSDNMENKTGQALRAMSDYLDAGGRVFASHYQNVWFKQGPAALRTVAEFDNQADLGDIVGQVVTSFPKGAALAQWLFNAGASEEEGEVAIAAAQHSVVTENPEFAQRWIATEEPASVQYFSANTPLGASDADQCGRVVFSDIHLSEGRAGDDISDSNPKFDFPNGCVTSEFTPQEAVLAFMLFDLSACVVPDNVVPVAPPPVILR